MPSFPATGRRAAPAILASCIASALFATLPITAAAQATAQTQVHRYDIPAQPLLRAVQQYSRISGVQVVFDDGMAGKLQSSPLAGEFGNEEALQRLLQGAGLTARRDGNSTVTLIPTPTTDGEGGVIVTGALAVEGTQGNVLDAGWDGSAETVYTTPRPVGYLSREDIETYRGTSPADILKGMAGVMSGEARTGGGLDVNIRGLQGQGRVPVLVDGMQNLTTVYRGYQGLSNRTYIEPDLIAGVSVEKGPSSGPGGAGAMGGVVRIRTIEASDIVPDGQVFGVRFRYSMIGNNTPVPAIGTNNLLTDLNAQRANVQHPSTFDMDGHARSLALAAKGDHFDILVAGTDRDVGNYHAGKHGSDAPKKADCNYSAAICNGYVAWYAPNDIRYLADEAVLNTSEDTTSTLVKGHLLWGDGHKLGASITRYRSTYGETYPSDTWDSTTRYQSDPVSLDLTRKGLDYVWKSSNPWIDLQTHLWHSKLLDQPPFSGGAVVPKEYSNITRTQGFDISNTSRFDLAKREVVLEYGLSTLKEEASSPITEVIQVLPLGRQGTRQQREGFLRGSWQMRDDLTLDASFRRQRYDLHDKSTYNYNQLTNGVPTCQLIGIPCGLTRREASANSWSFGATWELLDGMQIYARYNDATRLPSLVEGALGFLIVPDSSLQPENTKSWDVGTNYTKTGLLTADDELGVKFGYFHSNVDDYISRSWTGRYMRIYNIDEAKFEGLELSTRYSIAGYDLNLSATKYLHIYFCQTAATCLNSSLSSDYANNQIPPDFSYSLNLSKKLLDDKVKLGARVTHQGTRAAGANSSQHGAMPFVQAVPWSPYTLVDVSASWQIMKWVALDLAVENLTDRYYVEPLSLGYVPAPGRTARATLEVKF